MEKMNQVSVSEFFAKSKEEMYDMAVEMVEKYNRLVDICNDSAERMAELMAKDDINEFKKELQSKEVGEFKIQKLADIVVWADNWITDLKDGLTEEEIAEDEEVKKFETVKKVVLESMERHTTYTNTLNKDIADKAAKIDLLEKEIEGRKEGYYNLKDRLDTAREIEDHWKREYEKKAADLDALNKTLEIRNKENGCLVKTIQTTRREIEAHEKQVKYLEKELNETCTCKELDLKGHQSRETALVNALADKNDEIKKLKEENTYLKKASENKNDIIRKAYARYVDEACKGREEIMDECYKNLAKDDTGYIGFKQYTLRALEKKEGNEKEAKKFICDSADIIFHNKKAEDKRKEETKEETVKYRPSEIDRFTYFLKDEVDKKRIVDIRYGVEDDLHVTRDLLVAAVKLIVAKGYHEYDGVVTGYGRFHVLTTPDVEFKELYDTWKIKSIGFDIPCGEDAIE